MTTYLRNRSSGVVVPVSIRTRTREGWWSDDNTLYLRARWERATYSNYIRWQAQRFAEEVSRSATRA